MGLLLMVTSFFLALVVTAMAYMEYKTTKDQIFMFLADAFAFFAVVHLATILNVDAFMGDVPVVGVQLIAYLVVIFGIYHQSKIYKIIK